jgi:16S rRNA (guanine966-N2)-methyltransferase
MRITGGSARGRRLATFKGVDIRPTSDLVREAVFNLLGLRRLSETRVLDLFAGTGSLGIEALSRGAAQAVFIDYSWKAIELVRKNLRLCGMEKSGLPLRADLAQGLPRGHPSLAERFDLAFLDPPYGKGLILPLLYELQGQGPFGPASLVVAQTERSQDLPRAVGNLETVKARTYGSTRITILELKEDA